MSRAAFEMDEQLKEIALRVAKDAFNTESHRAWSYEGGDANVLEFASRFLAALPKPEPVAIVGELSEPTRSEVIAKGNPIGRYLYAAPPIKSAQGWQPIETAPKDGSVLMLWTKYGEYPIFGKYSATYDEWLEYGGSEYKFTPTHWMPLPAAPGAATPPTAALADDVVRDAERYRWLVSGKRRGWIWDHVLTSEDRAMGNWLHEVIDAAIAAAKGGAVLSADADNWIKWRGGECPLLPGTLVQIKFSNGGTQKSKRRITFVGIGNTMGKLETSSPTV